MKMRRKCATWVGLVTAVAAATMSASPVSAIHTSWNVFFTGSGATWNVQPVVGTGESRAWATCNSNGLTQYGPWKTLNLTSSTTCGPQGVGPKGLQTR